MSSTADVISQADACHAKLDIKGNNAILEEAFKSNQDPEISWRLGRSLYDLAQESTDKTEKQNYINRGIELVKTAVDALPDSFAVHKWNGIMLGAQGDFLSTKEKIGNAYTIRDHFKKATELNPADATSFHCMGKWCWSVLQIGWVERQAASLLFATPPSSTYEECEEYLLKSADLDKQQSYNNLLLGDLYYQQKKWGDAKVWYQAAVDCEATTENQRRQQEEAKTKLGKC